MVDMKKFAEDYGYDIENKSSVRIDSEDIRGLLDHIAQFEKDAARYRVFRANEDGVSVACTWNGNTGATPYINGKELDECADSWIAIEEKNSSNS